MVQGLYGNCVEVHRVYISDRGGNRRIAEIVDVSQVRWTRLRDNVSDASVIIAGAACEAQAATLADIEPRRHELVIYRGDDRVWEGPINLITYLSDRVEIHARDISDYVYHRPLSVNWDNTKESEAGIVPVTTRMYNIIRYELANQYFYEDDDGNVRALPGWEQVDPPANIRKYVTAHHFPNEVVTAAYTTPYQMTVGEHMDNFARTGGLDWTVVGRSLHLWDTNRSIGKTRTLTEADFFSDIITSLYGNEYASAAFAVASDGRYGGAGGIKTDWRFNEKTAVNGTALTLEPAGSTPFEPSLADAGVNLFADRRYWMAYSPDGSTNMRVAGTDTPDENWNDLRGGPVDDNDDGTPLAGRQPTVAFAYGSNIWLFYMNGGKLWRTRSEDGIDWTQPVELNTATWRSPSLTYRPESKDWVLYVINDGGATYNVRRLISTGQTLTSTTAFQNEQTCTLNNAPAGKHPVYISAHRQGSQWQALITFADTGTTTTNTVVYTATAPTNNPTNFTVASSPTLPGVTSTLNRADFFFDPDGDMPMIYGVTPGGGNEVRLTELTGPDPVVVDGDVNIDYYGPWTDIYTIEDEGFGDLPTQAELNGQARRNLAGRSPVPMVVRVPDNSGVRLSPDFTIQHLVPGVYIPLLARLNARPFSQLQKLDRVTVTETSSGENIQVVLIPASAEDTDEEV